MYSSVRDRPAKAAETPEGPQGPAAGTRVTRARVAAAVAAGEAHRPQRQAARRQQPPDRHLVGVGQRRPAALPPSMGFSPLGFGFFDGIYQGMSAVLRIFGGWIADRSRRHKEVAGAGYALSAASKIGLLATTTAAPTTAVLLARPDRQGHPHRTPRRAHLVRAASPRTSAPRSASTGRSTPSAPSSARSSPSPSSGTSRPTTTTPSSSSASASPSSASASSASSCRTRPGSGSTPPGPRCSPRPAGLRELMAKQGVPPDRGGRRAAQLRDGQRRLHLPDLRAAGSSMDPVAFPLLFVGTALAYLLLAVPLGRLADRIGRAPVFIGGHVVLIGCYAVLRISGPGLATKAADPRPARHVLRRHRRRPHGDGQHGDPRRSCAPAGWPGSPP